MRWILWLKQTAAQEIGYAKGKAGLHCCSGKNPNGLLIGSTRALNNACDISWIMKEFCGDLGLTSAARRAQLCRISHLSCRRTPSGLQQSRLFDKRECQKGRSIKCRPSCSTTAGSASRLATLEAESQRNNSVRKDVGKVQLILKRVWSNTSAMQNFLMQMQIGPP